MSTQFMLVSDIFFRPSPDLRDEFNNYFEEKKEYENDSPFLVTIPAFQTEVKYKKFPNKETLIKLARNNTIKTYSRDKW